MSSRVKQLKYYLIKFSKFHALRNSTFQDLKPLDHLKPPFTP